MSITGCNQGAHGNAALSAINRYQNESADGQEIRHGLACDSSINGGQHPHTLSTLVHRWCVFDSGTPTYQKGLLSVDRTTFAIPAQDRHSLMLMKLLARRNDGVELYGEMEKWRLASIPGKGHRVLKGRIEKKNKVDAFIADKSQPNLPFLLKALPDTGKCPIEFAEKLQAGLSAEELDACKNTINTWASLSFGRDSVSAQISKALTDKSQDTIHVESAAYISIATLPAVFDHLVNVREFYASGTDLRDESLEEVTKIGDKLRVAKLNDTKITSNGISVLAVCCPNLEMLELASVKLCDEGLKPIAEHCKNLERLNVSNTGITDKGVKGIIQHCRKLEYLDIRDTHLTKLPNLKNLPPHCTVWMTDLNFTSRDLAEIKRLRKNRMGLDIRFSLPKGMIGESALNDMSDDRPASSIQKNFTKKLANLFTSQPLFPNSSKTSLPTRTDSGFESLQKDQGLNRTESVLTKATRQTEQTTASIRLASEFRSKDLEKTERRILADLDLIYDKNAPSTRRHYYDMCKLAFICWFDGARMLRSGVRSYDLKVSAGLGAGAISGAPSAIAPVLGTIKHLFDTALQQSEHLPMVGTALRAVFEAWASRESNKSNECVSTALDLSSDNINRFADTMARALTRMHLNDVDNPDGDGSAWQTMNDYFVTTREYMSGTNLNESSQETKIRLLATRHASEIVLAMACDDQELKALLDPALDNAERPYQTDHLKVKPALQWHCAKHKLNIADNELDGIHTWREIDGRIPRERIDEKVRKAKAAISAQGDALDTGGRKIEGHDKNISATSNGGVTWSQPHEETQRMNDQLIQQVLANQRELAEENKRLQEELQNLRLQFAKERY